MGFLKEQGLPVFVKQMHKTVPGFRLGPGTDIPPEKSGRNRILLFMQMYPSGMEYSGKRPDFNGHDDTSDGGPELGLLFPKKRNGLMGESHPIVDRGYKEYLSCQWFDRIVNLPSGGDHRDDNCLEARRAFTKTCKRVCFIVVSLPDFGSL